MRIFLTLMLAAAFCAPMFAEDTPPKTDEKPAPKVETKPEVKKEMGEDAKKLYEDMERVYAKYYEVVLDAMKQDKVYDADQTWDLAVKETKNSTYKDRKEFFKAVAKMQKADKPFKEKSTKLINDSADAHTAALKKWLADSEEKDKPKEK